MPECSAVGAYRDASVSAAVAGHDAEQSPSRQSRVRGEQDDSVTAEAGVELPVFVGAGDRQLFEDVFGFFGAHHDVHARAGDEDVT